MPFYPGRTDQLMDVRFTGGINKSTTQINVRDHEARDLLNVDLGLDGSIKPRGGYAVLTTLSGGTPSLLAQFFTQMGVQRFVAVVGTKLWMATEINGTWTDITGSLTLTDGTQWIPAASTGKLFLANGKDEPIVIDEGGIAKTLKEASLVGNPYYQSAAFTGTPGPATCSYAVVHYTARGESVPTTFLHVTGAASPLDATNYVTLNWTNVVGSQGCYIYKLDTTWKYLASVSAGVTSYVDNAAATPSFTRLPISVATSYNTPLDWETNGYPTGFYALKIGTGSRLLAYRGNQYWVSALNDPYDWHTINSAFDGYIVGGKDNVIRAIFDSYEYTIFLTQTNGFFYTGSGPTDFVLAKTLGVGTVAPFGGAQPGDDVYLWGQYGPTTIQRVQSGADIKTASFGDRVDTYVNASNKSKWNLIYALKDVRSRRIIWFFPSTSTSTVCDKAIVYYSQVDAWSVWDGWPVASSLYDPVSQNVFALFTNSKIVQLNSGTTDGSDTISWYYETGDQDMRSYQEKRLLWVDTVVDGTSGSYSFTVVVTQDGGRVTGSTHTLTATTTDGGAIETYGTSFTSHRLYESGHCRFFKIRMAGSTLAGGTPKIIGQRPEVRMTGVG